MFLRNKHHFIRRNERSILKDCDHAFWRDAPLWCRFLKMNRYRYLNSGYLRYRFLIQYPFSLFPKSKNLFTSHGIHWHPLLLWHKKLSRITFKKNVPDNRNTIFYCDNDERYLIHPMWLMPDLFNNVSINPNTDPAYQIQAFLLFYFYRKKYSRPLDWLCG